MKVVGIIGAMPSELAEFREKLGASETKTAAKYEYHISNIGDKQIIHVCCGIGKVNAAVCTQVLIDVFGAECIINTGIAGGVHDNTKVCDIVISKDVMHHDLLPRFLENYTPFNSAFKGDDKLIEYAVSACKDSGETYHIQRIVSGEVFISSNEVRDKIIEEFDPYAVDMETAAIAHTAFRNDIPFVSVRCISDKADEESEMSFEEFEHIAAKKVAGVVIKMVNTL